MTDIALNGHIRPLSLNYEALKKRAQRAGVPVAVQRERERDMGLAHVPRVTPNKVPRSPPRDIRLATSRDGPPCDISRDNKAMSPLGTKQKDQRLRVVPLPHEEGTRPIPVSLPSPSLQPGLSPPVAVPVRRKVTFGRVIVALLGVLFLAGDLGTNTTYLVGQGRELFDMFSLGIIAVAYQLGLVVTPTLLGIFWREHWFGYVLVGIVFMLVSFAAAIYAATGFVNANFGDTQAGRAATIKQRNAWQADLDRARDERRTLVFEPATQAQVDAARDGLKNCDRRNESDECRSRRRKQADLLDRQTKTERADDLDNKIIPRLQAKVDAVTAVKSADPQIDGVVLMLARVSVVIDPQTAESWRLLIFIVLPLAAGLMFAWAEVLGERRRA